MTLDERKDSVLIFIGDSRNPRTIIEIGDEATLYHEYNLIMATISEIKDNQFRGTITRSSYDPDMHASYITGKDIFFSKQNIFGISKKNNQA